MLQRQNEGKLTRGYPLGATGVQKRRRSTSMSWSYEQQHLHAFLPPQLPRQKHVYLRIDNTTAVESITKRGLQEEKREKKKIPIDLSEVLQTRSESLCIPLKSSSSPVCFELPGSGSTSCRRLSPRLEQVDL